MHLVSGSQPILRVNGELQRVQYALLENDDLKKMLYEVAPEYKIKQFEETGDIDFAYEDPWVSALPCQLLRAEVRRRCSVSPNSRYDFDGGATWLATGPQQTADVSPKASCW